MMSLTFGLFTQVSGSGPLGPLVTKIFLSLALKRLTSVFHYHGLGWRMEEGELFGHLLKVIP